MLQKTQNSCVRDEGQFLTAIIVARLPAFFASVSQAPIPTGGCEEGHGTPAYASGFYYRRGTGAGWMGCGGSRECIGKWDLRDTKEHSFWKRMERGRMWKKILVK